MTPIRPVTLASPPCLGVVQQGVGKSDPFLPGSWAFGHEPGAAGGHIIGV